MHAIFGTYMRLREHVILKPYTTFRLGGSVSYFADLAGPEDVVEYARFAREKGLPLLIIGGGSNVIFPDMGELHACVGHMQIAGFEIKSEDAKGTEIQIGAGEEWDSVVARTVALGLAGLEALSAIPGSVGATPVQNVGAYGQEIADTLLSVEVYDLDQRTIRQMSKEECNFSYRDSIFKHAGKGRYVILSVTLKLSKNSPQIPDYPGVKAYFDKKNIQNPGLKEIRDAIIDIRRVKLPDPKEIASCGSFFKSPLVTKEHLSSLQKKYPTIIAYAVQNGMYKLAAGRLLELLGFKGRRFGRIEVYPYHALVLVNTGNATREELLSVVKEITDRANEAYGVSLEVEPVFVA